MKIIYLPLSRGLFAMVDSDCLGEVLNKKWSADPSGEGKFRAIRRVPGGNKKELLHRVIMQCPPELEVDHIDGNPLNNLRQNLRLATHRENGRNLRKMKGCSSQFKGVYWHARDKHWRAQIQTNRVNKQLGFFQDEKSAALAYDREALLQYGQFARLNFPCLT